MQYTTDDLITGIKRRGAIPTAQATFQTSDFLAMADAEIRSNLLPTILSARESYYSFDVSYSINANNAVYGIPTRAIGVKLQNVFVYDTQSNRYQLNLVDEGDITNPGIPISGNPSFFIKGNNIVLVPPNPSNFVTLTTTIFIRPNQLAQTSVCAQVTAVNTGTGTLTFSSLPASWTTSSVVDLIKGTPHYDCLAIDQTPTSVTTTTLVFSSLPTGIAVGDWVALAQTAPVVQIPTEFQPILEQRVANAYLQSQGFLQGLAAGQKSLADMQKSFLLINPRSERNLKKIVNRSGVLRRWNWWP